MRLIPVTITLAAILSAAGCGADKPTSSPAAPAASVASPTPASPSEAADPQGALACRLVSEAMKGDRQALMKDGTVEAISEAAGGSSDIDIRFAGQMLSDRYDLAAASVGSSDETSNSVNLLTAAIKLETACAEDGLDTE